MAKERISRGDADESHVVVTPSALVVSLSKSQQQKARKCLEESGEVKFSLREVSVTRLVDSQITKSVEVD
jgi:hypothetical protein